MKSSVETPVGTVKINDRIRIIRLEDCNGVDIQASLYTGAEGRVTYIDDLGQLFGTWGGLAVIPSEDKFEIL